MGAVPQADGDAAKDSGWTPAARRVMGLLVLVNAGSQGLQGLMAPITRELEAGLSVSLATVGAFQTLFLITFAIATACWGVFANRVSPRRSLIAASLLWGGCCALVTLTSTPALFASGLCLAAVGNAAIIPLTYSVAMAIVPREERATSLGWLGTGQALSMGLAFLAGGGLVGRFGWQAPFLLFAGSGFLAVILLALCLPKDEDAESREVAGETVGVSGSPESGKRSGLAALSTRIAAEFAVLRQPGARNVVISTVFSAMADGSLAFWFIAMLREDHQLSVMDATLLTVTLFVAQLPGGVICGRFADAAERKWERGRTRLAILLSVVAGGLYFGLFQIPWSELSLTSPACLLFCVLAVIGAFISAALPPLLFNAATEVVARPQREVMISAVSVSRIAGRAIGVQCVGLLTTTQSSSSLSMSIAITTLCFLPSAILLQRVVTEPAT